MVQQLIEALDGGLGAELRVILHLSTEPALGLVSDAVPVLGADGLGALEGDLHGVVQVLEDEVPVLGRGRAVGQRAQSSGAHLERRLGSVLAHPVGGRVAAAALDEATSGRVAAVPARLHQRAGIETQRADDLADAVAQRTHLVLRGLARREGGVGDTGRQVGRLLALLDAAEHDADDVGDLVLIDARLAQTGGGDLAGDLVGCDTHEETGLAGDVAPLVDAEVRHPGLATEDRLGRVVAEGMDELALVLLGDATGDADHAPDVLRHEQIAQVHAPVAHRGRDGHRAVPGASDLPLQEGQGSGVRGDRWTLACLAAGRLLGLTSAQDRLSVLVVAHVRIGVGEHRLARHVERSVLQRHGRGLPDASGLGVDPALPALAPDWRDGSGDTGSDTTRSAAILPGLLLGLLHHVHQGLQGPVGSLSTEDTDGALRNSLRCGLCGDRGGLRSGVGGRWSAGGSGSLPVDLGVLPEGLDDGLGGCRGLVALRSTERGVQASGAWCEVLDGGVEPLASLLGEGRHHLGGSTTHDRARLVGAGLPAQLGLGPRLGVDGLLAVLDEVLQPGAVRLRDGGELLGCLLGRVLDVADVAEHRLPHHLARVVEARVQVVQVLPHVLAAVGELLLERGVPGVRRATGARGGHGSGVGHTSGSGDRDLHRPDLLPDLLDVRHAEVDVEGLLQSRFDVGAERGRDRLQFRIDLDRAGRSRTCSRTLRSTLRGIRLHDATASLSRRPVETGDEIDVLAELLQLRLAGHSELDGGLLLLELQEGLTDLIDLLVELRQVGCDRYAKRLIGIGHWSYSKMVPSVGSSLTYDGDSICSLTWR